MKKFLFVMLIFMLGYVISISGAVAAETNPPEVTILNPANHSTVAGAISEFEARSSEPVNNAYLFIDGNYTGASVDVNGGTLIKIPYNLDTTSYPSGYSLSVHIVCFTASGENLLHGTSQVTVSADTEPPVTTAILEGTKKNDSGWFVSDVTVTMSAADYPNPGGSGVASTVYGFGLSTLDWIDYNTPFKITNEGVTEIVYKSTDKAGNNEEIRFAAVKIDKTAPTTTVKLNGSNEVKNWYNSNVTVELSAVDNPTNGVNSGADMIKYSYDGYTWNVYTSSLSIITEGKTNLYYRASDKAGNIETVGQISFNIDKTNPSASIVEPSNDQTVSPRGQLVHFTMYAFDNSQVAKVELYCDGVLQGEATHYYGVDEASGPYDEYHFKWPAVYGIHTFMAKSYDAAGNTNTSSNVTIKVPTIITMTNPVNGSIVSGTISNFKATTMDPIGNVYMYIDDVKVANMAVNGTNIDIAYNWDTTKYANNSTHYITLEGISHFDAILSRTTSVVTVRYMTITPTNTVSGIVNNFTATTVDTIQRAELYIDGQKKVNVENINGTSISIPYSWDTTQLTENSYHIIEIRAYTAEGTQIIGKNSVMVDNVPETGG